MLIIAEARKTKSSSEERGAAAGAAETDWKGKQGHDGYWKELMKLPVSGRLHT